MDFMSRPRAARSLASSNGRKETAALGLIVNVEPERPAIPTAWATPSICPTDFRHAPRNQVGSCQRCAIGQIDADNQVALVLIGNEAGWHQAKTETCGN
jgi:hypothetical protein